MVETDWKSLLNLYQKDLTDDQKDELCKSLSWMEADDIELNFSDLKTLFRLAQDVLQYKSKQVNLLNKTVELLQNRNNNDSLSLNRSPLKSHDSVFDTITHQEEIIKTNKEILEQLYEDIAVLESKKKSFLMENETANGRDSESSRDPLSEMDAVVSLENEVSMKNKHIRKMLTDIKVLEEENILLREKLSVLKKKLEEATKVIENLTDEVFRLQNESSLLKEALGKLEQTKALLSLEMENLQKHNYREKSDQENIHEKIKAKLQHWKHLAHSKKTENEKLANENTNLKDEMLQMQHQFSSTKIIEEKEEQIKELKEKLSEASDVILHSAKLLEVLKAENKYFEQHTIVEFSNISVCDPRNESDDGKQQAVINGLKSKILSLSATLQNTEEALLIKEKEVAKLTSQLQLLQSGNEGMVTLIDGLKTKKNQLKTKNQEVKSLVREMNTLNNVVNELQVENEAMRQTLNIPSDGKVSTKGILSKFQQTEQNALEREKKVQKLENYIVTLELEQHRNNVKLSKLKKLLSKAGYNQNEIDTVSIHNVEEMPVDGGGESTLVLTQNKTYASKATEDAMNKEDLKAVIDENEGLRKGLCEILEFLKNNNTKSTLSVHCPSLETVLTSMEARHAAGWFAPHMAAMLDLKAAIGGRDALLTALNEARNETFDIMTQLSKESEKSLQLQNRLQELEANTKSEKNIDLEFESKDTNSINGVFGTWILDKEYSHIDYNNKTDIENLIRKGDTVHEIQLKNGLAYFHSQFRSLYQKMTNVAIQSGNEKSKWTIEKEKYEAEIENLKTQLDIMKDDRSECSDGVIEYPNINTLIRKCSYLEESYRYVRTLNENIKNELLESERNNMIKQSDYENQIQSLILNVATLTDKLRNSVPLKIFLKQSSALNDIGIKYHHLLENTLYQNIDYSSLYQDLEQMKNNILGTFQKKYGGVVCNGRNDVSQQLSNILAETERAVLENQLKHLCTELEKSTSIISDLKKCIKELQEIENKLINNSLESARKEDYELLENEVQALTNENKNLKQEYQILRNNSEILMLQSEDSQQRQISNDMEVNMLRHQILDLQSTGDNKAIIARLSSEILTAHLQASENLRKIEHLNYSLNREKKQRIKCEEMLKTRERIFNVYASRFEFRFRHIFEVMQTLRQQYQGCLPITSIENYLNNTESASRKTAAVNEKLSEVEDLRTLLIGKHDVYDEIIKISNIECDIEDKPCPHQWKFTVEGKLLRRELDHCNNKIRMLELNRMEITRHCNELEKILVLVNQGFDKSPLDNIETKSVKDKTPVMLEVEDINTDNSEDESSRRSQTITLSKPRVLKSPSKKSTREIAKLTNKNTSDSPVLPGSPVKIQPTELIPEVKKSTIYIQTEALEVQRVQKLIQTEKVPEFEDHLKDIVNLKKEKDHKNEELNQALSLASIRANELIKIYAEKTALEATLAEFKRSTQEKELFIKNMQKDFDQLNNELMQLKSKQMGSTKEKTNKETKHLLDELQKLTNEKNIVVNEFKELLRKERAEYANNIIEFQKKVTDLQMELDRKNIETSDTDAVKHAVAKYSTKFAELEDERFKLINESDNYKTDIIAYQSELERWKLLASERLSKMEQLNSILNERHSDEVASYKAENHHWLSQFNESNRGIVDLRTKLSEQKIIYTKQLAEKDAHIDHLRTLVHNLKAQILNMQTLVSVTDPNLDLSAIIEVDETSDDLSQHSPERLELKFDSSQDLQEFHEDMGTGETVIPASIWHEPVIERLRREKQLIAKQNSMLRRQIKALAARERRARLEAQNLKNQVYRISTSGCKSVTAETAVLQNKIASLQTQLNNARRDTQSSVAIWDKWKRAQQAAEKWQLKYEEKCVELRKCDLSLTHVKAAILRLEREKRVLLGRISDVSDEKHVPPEKDVEKATLDSTRTEQIHNVPPHISVQSLMDRVEAQQRRIAALELAQNGNEPLVTEYEKALAEITALKGRILKLESSVLESQIRNPLNSSLNTQPEVEYWKSYCEMLKEENMQMSFKMSTAEVTSHSRSHSPHQQRINDLEQTVLTLRGLVSKLHAEQRSMANSKRVESSRPGSGKSASDRDKSQLEPLRTEIANLKRTITDKDLLLEKSKEMLRMAADREDDLLRENSYLRRRLNELSAPTKGFMSA